MKLSNSSRFIMNGTSRKTSKLIKAFQMGADVPLKFPDGQFGRVAILRTTNVVIDSKDLDFEFTIPFDDDPEANESEIIIYNLSNDTVKQFKVNNPINVTAGYKDDTGVVLKGYISKATTKHEGVDKVTTVKVIDTLGKKDFKIESTSYKEGTKASYILKDLAGKLSIPIAVFKIARDFTYKDKVTEDGEIMDSIKKYAEVCGVSAYINKGQLYIRPLSDGDNINFTVNENTGLIGSPEEFQEEITAEDYKDTIKGYKLQMLLQHRMTTAAIINLSSRGISGKFRVRSGKHTFNQSEAITEIEVIS